MAASDFRLFSTLRVIRRSADRVPASASSLSCGASLTDWRSSWLRAGRPNMPSIRRTSDRSASSIRAVSANGGYCACPWPERFGPSPMRVRKLLLSCEPVSPCGVPKGRVGDYAESHSGLPPQTVFSGSERTWARFSPQIMRGIMRAVGAIMRSPNMDGRFCRT